MHALDGPGEALGSDLRERIVRGRLLAVQGAVLAALDAAEAAKALALAARLAPGDALVRRLARDLEGSLAARLTEGQRT